MAISQEASNAIWFEDKSGKLPGYIHYFHANIRGDLLITSYDGKEGTTTRLSTASEQGKVHRTPSCLTDGSRIDCFWKRKGSDGSFIMHTVWDGEHWTTNQLSSTRARSRPFPVRYGSRIDVFFRGHNNALQDTFWENNKWQNKQISSGPLQHTPSARHFSKGPGPVYWWNRETNQLNTTVWDGQHWNSSVLSKEHEMDSSPIGLTGAYDSANRIDIVYRSKNGSLISTFTASADHYADGVLHDGNNGKLKSSPVPVCSGHDRIHIFWVDHNGALMNTHWLGAKWESTKVYDGHLGSVHSFPTAVSHNGSVHCLWENKRGVVYDTFSNGNGADWKTVNYSKSTKTI